LLVGAALAGCDAGPSGDEAPQHERAAAAPSSASPAAPARDVDVAASPDPGYRSRAELLAAMRRDGKLSSEAIEGLGRELARLDGALPVPAGGRSATASPARRTEGGVEVARSAVAATGAIHFENGWAWGTWVRPEITAQAIPNPAQNGVLSILEYTGYGDWQPGYPQINANASTWYDVRSKFKWSVSPGFYRGYYDASIDPNTWSNGTSQNQYGLVVTIYQGTTTGWVPIYQNATYPNWTNIFQGTKTWISTYDLFHPNTGYLFVVSSYCSADPGGWRSGSFQAIAL
jgi:hypothetical protein